MSVLWKRVISQEDFDNWHNKRNKFMDDILKDYEEKISSRIQTLDLRAGLLQKISNEDDDWGLHFDLPLDDSEENKNKARQICIEIMKSEMRFLKNKLIEYQNVLDARRNKEEDNG